MARRLIKDRDYLTFVSLLSSSFLWDIPTAQNSGRYRRPLLTAKRLDGNTRKCSRGITPTLDIRGGLNHGNLFRCLIITVMKQKVWSTDSPPRRIGDRLALVSTCRRRDHNGFLETHDALSRRRNQDLWVPTPAGYGSPWGRGECEVSLLARIPQSPQSLSGHVKAVPLSAVPTWTRPLLWVWVRPRYCCLERKCVPSKSWSKAVGAQGDSSSSGAEFKNMPVWFLGIQMVLIFSVLFAQWQ